MVPREDLFSPAALAILDRQQYDPVAKGSYELLSGGLIWSDELPRSGTPDGAIVRALSAYRFLFASRASITLDEKCPKFRPVWEQVLQGAPIWPGLRPDRRGERARKRLLAAQRREDKCLAEWEQQLKDSERSKPE
jgi:hypothetical protein